MRTRIVRIARNAQRGLTLLEIMIVIAILGILIAVIAPRVIDAFSESKVKTTGIQVKNFANWFVQWQAKQTGGENKACPDSLLEVGRAVDSKMKETEANDAWGRPLKFKCGEGMPAEARGIAVWSTGDNGKDENGAGDDIKSW